MQKPASKSSIDKMIYETSQVLNFEGLADEYLVLLKKSNGVEFNGVQVYASERSLIEGFSDREIEGFVQANLIWRNHETKKDFVVYAESGSRLYIQNIKETHFEILDRYSLDIISTKPSFKFLLIEALKNSLDIFD